MVFFEIRKFVDKSILIFCQNLFLRSYKNISVKQVRKTNISFK